MEKPFFSIIVPVYNVEQYLSTCLDSILSQKFKNYEILLIDDKSSDNSLKLCKKYENSNEKIKLFINDKNLGLAGCRNVGLSNMQGQWMICIDPDDYIKNDNFLDNIYKACKNNDIVFYGYTKFEQNKNIEITQHEDVYKSNDIEDKTEKIRYLKSHNNWYWSAWSHAYRIDFLQKNNITFDQAQRQAEDCKFLYESMIYYPKITAVKDTSYMYRQRPNSLTQYNDKTAKYAIEVTKKTCNLVYEAKLDKEYKTALLETIAYNYATTFINIERSLNGKEKEDAFTTMANLKYIYPYASDKKTKLCISLLKIFGTKCGSKIIYILHKLAAKR